MKRLVFLCLMFTPFVMCGQNSSILWKKADSARESGKPQVEASFLKKLEASAVKNGDELEHLYISQRLYDAVSQYNWKEASDYWPTCFSLQRKFKDSLDAFIPEYEGHRRQIILLYWRIEDHYNRANSLSTLSGEAFLEVRRECTEILKSCKDDQYREKINSIISRMDARHITASVCRQSAPGDSAVFSLTTKNVPQTKALVYRVRDDFPSESLYYRALNAGLSSESDLLSFADAVGEYVFNGFENQYNVSQKKDVGIVFPNPGIYVVHFCSEGCDEFVSLNVSDIAVAARYRNQKCELYAADLTTGRPLESATVTSYRGARGEIATASTDSLSMMESRGCRFDGFTPQDNDEALFFKVSTSTDVASPLIYPYKWRRGGTYAGQKMKHHNALFTDRSLYRPGDTIFFKCISYTSDATRGSVDSLVPLNVSFRHSSSKKDISSLSLLTNDMGSASGMFIIPSDGKNGTYILSCGGNSCSVRVESYKRPTFSMILNKPSQVWCFSDIVSLEGRLESYAGYSVTGATVEYEVERRPSYRFGHYSSCGPSKVASGTLCTDRDGLFAINFCAERPESDSCSQNVSIPAAGADSISCIYRIKVKAVTSQGETLEKTLSITVSDVPLDISLDVPSISGGSGRTIIDRSCVNGFTLRTTNPDGVPYDVSGKYEVTRDGKKVYEGWFDGNRFTEFDFNGFGSGIYSICAVVDFRGVKITRSTDVTVISRDDRKLPFDEELFFCQLREENAVDFLVGTAEENLYLEMELLDGDSLLLARPLHLQDEMIHIELPYKSSYSSAVTLSLLGFRNGKFIEKRCTFTNPRETKIDLSVKSFRDKTSPRAKETVTFGAAAGAEMLVSIFDTSAGNRMSSCNSFTFNPLRQYYIKNVPTVNTTLEEGFHPFYNLRVGMKSVNGGLLYASDDFPESDIAAFEDSASSTDSDDDDSSDSSDDELRDASMRKDMRELIGFYPHVKVGPDGTAAIEYQTNDLLSTFKILAMAHDRNLRSGDAGALFVVTKPVMVVPNLPMAVRVGDEIVLKAAIINNMASSITGTARIDVRDSSGNKILKLKDKKLFIPSDGQIPVSWSVKIPNVDGKMMVSISFSDGRSSDGESSAITVEPSSLTLTEAASFIIGTGRGYNYLEKQFRKQFSKFSPIITRAEYSAIDAVREALCEPLRPDCDNSVEWICSLYASRMRNIVSGILCGGSNGETAAVTGADAAAGTAAAAVSDFSGDEQFRAEAMDKIISYQNSDGGIRWFSGMRSSTTLTLFYLEKMAQLRELGAMNLQPRELESVRKAIRYLDARMDSNTDPLWLDVRLRWVDQPLGGNAGEMMERSFERLSNKWHSLSILSKAQYCSAMLRCRGGASDNGPFAALIDSVSASLEDYSVENETVGCYFPNAVAPMSGLMDNDIYAHAQLMTLFRRLGSERISKGVSQWLLLQKHNRAWKDKAASADAVYALVSSKTSDLRFGAVYCTYSAALDQVAPSSNGIEVTRQFFRQDGTILCDGDVLNAGERVTIRYQISSSEKRSFVRMRAMRPCSLYPVDGRSYYSWYGYYRDVRESFTEYYWEMLPDCRITIEESFHVNQTGTFSSGLVMAECLYATEYRGHTDSRDVTSR